MTTFGELIDECITWLHGHTTDVPAVANLSVGIDADSTELAMDFGGQPWAGRPNGVIEIGSELILVTSYDATSGVARLSPWGRGFRGTTAAAHAVNSMITVRPRYPRKHVGRVLNEVIRASSPPLYAARDLPVIDTGSFVDLGYPLPADTLRVLRVEATENLVSDELAYRQVLRDWTVRNVAGTQLLELDRCDVHQDVLITIAADPTPLVNEADDFAATTGLPESCTDLIVFGAIARLVLAGDLARQQVTSVEAQTRNDKAPSGSARQISTHYQALYLQRLEQEHTRLMQQYPLTLLRRG